MKRLKITLALFVFCLPMNIIPAQAQHLERNTFELAAGAGRRAYINSKKAMLRATFSGYYNIRLHPLWDLKLGGDAIYYDTKYDGNPAGPGYLIRVSSYEHFSYAGVVGFDFKMNRLMLEGGVGRYIHFNSLYDLKYYTKVGLRYLITPNLTTGFSMRAHANEADYIDFGLSVKF